MRWGGRQAASSSSSMRGSSAVVVQAGSVLSMIECSFSRCASKRAQSCVRCPACPAATSWGGCVGLEKGRPSSQLIIVIKRAHRIPWQTRQLPHTRSSHTSNQGTTRGRRRHFAAIFSWLFSRCPFASTQTLTAFKSFKDCAEEAQGGGNRSPSPSAGSKKILPSSTTNYPSIPSGVWMRR